MLINLSSLSTLTRKLLSNYLYNLPPNDMLLSFFVIICAILPLQFALNPAATVDLAIIRLLIPMMLIACLIHSIRTKTPIKIKSVLDFQILFFLFLSVFSTLFSINFQWSLRKLAFLFSIFPIYFIASYLLENEKLRLRAISALVIGGTMVSIFSIIQFFAQFLFGIRQTYAFLANNIIPFFLGNNFSKEVLAYPSWLVNSGGTTYMRAFAPFPDPHMLSYYVGMLLPWSIAIWATNDNKYHKFFYLFSSVALTVCDVATFTRGGYIAIMIAAIMVLPLVPKNSKWKIIAAVFAFTFIFFVVPKNPVTSPVTNRISSTFDLNEGSNQGRMAIWKQTLSIISKHPQGVGIGNYPLVIDSNATYRTPIYSHNVYLDVAVELGIFPMIIFILIIALSIKNFWLYSQKNSFYIAGVASLLVFAIHSLVENPIYSVHVLPLFLILIAISSNLNFSSCKK